MINLINKPNQVCGKELLLGITSETLGCVFLDPQYQALPSEKIETIMSKETVTDLIKESVRVLKPEGHLFLWISKNHLIYHVNFVLKSLWENQEEIKVVDHIVSTKPITQKGLRTTQSTDHLLIIQKKPHTLSRGWVNQGIKDNWSFKKKTKHPQEKPLELAIKLIAAVTTKNDIVGDFAAGSYMVMAACAKSRRDFIGCDKYVTEQEAIANMNIFCGDH